MVQHLPFGEDSLDLVSQLLSGLFVGQFVLSHNLFQLLSALSEFSGDLESGWKNVVVVDDFGEWLKSGSSLYLGLAHSLGNSEWSSFHTSNQSVRERPSLLSLIELFDYNGLLTCSSACKQNNNSARFHSKTK